MPELPEAETIVRDLRARLPGRRVSDVEVVRPDILAPDLTPQVLAAALRGRAFDEIGRRGKNVVLRFDGDVRVVVNLGMTGRLVMASSPRAAELSHVAARFRLEDGDALLFDDTRRFGRFDLYDAAGWAARSAELGAEPLSDEFTAGALYDLTRTSRTPIRNWLLDQRRVAGVGNIYANEALFRARIDPKRPARSLTRAESRRLRDALREVLAQAIERRGTTLSDYRDGTGAEGLFAHQLQVYGRAGEPCVRCGRPVERRVLSNRSYFFCPKCQR
ncbi:MAG TPA: bifunctional DNA-formamidopyrimidine glycosylase/DNA-(apurinic or apyrimidinic site) lyase [Longimicrobiales bacterium]|nr:bifunctional DNA-formamidopyrimidine glycosylase/DNA-(apurinic or apyrimidinic site) lyase [Longimicrobiales bacterium]